MLTYYNSPDCINYQDSVPLRKLEGEEKPVQHMVTVSDSIFISLHQRFDRKEKYVCTGKKDGTNRGPLRRLRNGNIISFDPRDLPRTHILPISAILKYIKLENFKPFSSYGQQILNSPKPFENSLFQYDQNHTFLGANNLSAKKLCKGPRCRDSVCDICSKTSTKKCATCQVTFYCSKKCQMEGWTKKGHKKQCKMFQKLLSHPLQSVVS